MLNEISQIEEDKYCMLSPVYEYPPHPKTQAHRRDQIGSCQRWGRVGWWVDKMDEGGQKVQNSSCEINKPWGCHVQWVDFS